MIKYINNLEDIDESNLFGFFVGWPNPPSPRKHYDLLKNSNHIWLAVDCESGDVIGFINSVSDKVLSAYIPLLEVKPEYQGQGVGGHLVELMIDSLKEYYMVDLMCDINMQGFYEKYEMIKSNGMIIRNYEMQCGR